MNKTHITSDLHLGHGRIIEYCNRPFKDVAEMDAEIIRRWNEVVDEDDTIYCLGDFALCADWRKQQILYKLNGYKILVLGNHDFWPKDRYKKEDKTWDIEQACYDYMKLGFDEVYGECEIEYKGWKLTHVPKEEKGKYLCGHVHEKWSVFDLRPHGAVNINVGVDVHNFYPQEIDKVIGLVK